MRTQQTRTASSSPFVRSAMSLVLAMAVSGLVRPAGASDAYDDEEEQLAPEEDINSGPKETSSSGLEAGGLAAPSALVEQGDDRTQVERELDEADQKDAGRGLEFVWLSADVGYQLAGLESLAADNLAPGASGTSASGAYLGAAGGVRLLYFTAGAHLRYGFLSEYRLFSLLAELGLRIPLGAWEPFTNLGVGVASVSGFEPTPEAEGMKPIRGVAARLVGGADYYLSDSFSVGVQVSGDLMFLKRRALSESSSCTTAAACPYLQRGSGTGATLTLALALGLHF